jgi:hypothetical protein
MSYGVNVEKNIAGAASYVDRILRGANPAELPVQAPTEFELVVNEKAARQLGLQLPRALLALADEVIDRSLPLVAQMRSADRPEMSLFWVNRTYDGHHQTDATDPNRHKECLLDHFVGASEDAMTICRRTGGRPRRSSQAGDELLHPWRRDQDPAASGGAAWPRAQTAPPAAAALRDRPAGPASVEQLADFAPACGDPRHS